MADWSQLPSELLNLISNKLNSDFYLLRFRSVCSTWRSSTPFPNPNHHHQKLPSKLPLLYNSFNDSNSKSTTLSLSKRTLFIIFPPPQNPTLNHDDDDDHYPWIININNSNNQLLNPLSHFSRVPRYFPPVLDFNDLSVVELGHELFLDNDDEFYSYINGLFFEKVVLFQIEPGFALLTIQVYGNLAVFRLGDDRWTTIPEMSTSYDDVCVFKGKPLAVDRTGRTVRVRVGVGIEPELGLDLVADPVFFGGDKKYLVESNGELLLVDKRLPRALDDDDDDDDDGACACAYGYDYDDDDDDGDDGGGAAADGGAATADSGGVVAGHDYGVEWIGKFDVYRLHEKEERWVELTSLGDRSLFLGDDCAFSISCSDLGSDFFGNCVIFKDDAFMRFEFEMGIFDLDTRKTRPLQKDYHNYYSLFMPPKWVGSR